MNAQKLKILLLTSALKLLSSWVDHLILTKVATSEALTVDMDFQSWEVEEEIWNSKIRLYTVNLQTIMIAHNLEVYVILVLIGQVSS